MEGKTDYTEEVEAIKLYLRDIKKHKGPLPFEEEQELAERISRGDEHARTQMINAYLKLVVEIGEDYLNSGLLYSDIIQEGNIGLMRTVNNYDYKKGGSFRTYALFWIRRTIEEAIMNQIKTTPPKYGTPGDVQLNPSTTIEEINKYEKIEKWLAELKDKEREVISLRFGLEGQEPKTIEEIGQKFGLLSERIREIETTLLEKLKRMTNMQD